MKVALVHDWLTGMRGGERMLERVARMWPEAPIYTLVWRRGAVSSALESHPIHTSFLQHLPAGVAHYRWYLPFFPRAIESFDFRGYDVLISTSHAVAKSAIPPPGAFHFCYVHTPMRYVWDLEDQYFPPGRFPWPLSWFVRRTCARLRAWDVATLDRVHALVTNSQHVADRIRRHYGREAEVIGGPVDLARFGRAADSPDPGTARTRDYYLLAGAFAPNKRGALAVEACRRLERRLVVVGSGQEERALRRLAPPGTEFRGWVDDEELPGIYAGARALLFPGEEDLGLMPIEALASGTPVIAFGRGGALETVGRGANPEALGRVAAGGVARVPGGMLFGTQTADVMAAAIGQFEREHFDPAELRSLAEPFAAERFDARFRDAFERAHAAWRREGRQAPRRSRPDFGLAGPGTAQRTVSR
jgi:glycosyltransferase involved in cell wall biosynthesis